MLRVLRSITAISLLALAAGASASATPTAPGAPVGGPSRSITRPKPGSALITTTDVAKTAAWYRDTLGFQLISERTGVQGRSALLERSGTLLEISEEDRLAEISNRGPFTVLVDDVDREIASLEAKGVEVLSEPRDELSSRFRVSRIYDGDRRVVELREPLGSGDLHLGRQEF